MRSPTAFFHLHTEVDAPIMLTGVTNPCAFHLGPASPSDLGASTLAWCGARVNPAPDLSLETWGHHPTGNERYCPHCAQAARQRHIALGREGSAPHHLSPLDVVRAPVALVHHLAVAAMSLVAPSD